MSCEKKLITRRKNIPNFELVKGSNILLILFKTVSFLRIIFVIMFAASPTIALISKIFLAASIGFESKLFSHSASSGLALAFSINSLIFEITPCSFEPSVKIASIIFIF